MFVHGSGPRMFDDARSVLLSAGIPEENIVENAYKGKNYLSVFFPSLEKALRLQRRIRLLQRPGFIIRLSSLRDADWKTRWKKYFKPFFITSDIRVVPVWKNTSVRRTDQAIYLDTTFAFGTGLHATTQMMAHYIEKCSGNCERFLDVGTGTGILSIIAARYGARIIHAIDSDGDSVKTARINFRVNHCRAVYCQAVDFRRYTVQGAFDFVAANLLTEDLICFQKKLARLVKPGGFLAVSGIFHENYRHFRGNFKPVGMAPVAVSHKKNWYALVYRKERE